LLGNWGGVVKEWSEKEVGGSDPRPQHNTNIYTNHCHSEEEKKYSDMVSFVSFDERNINKVKKKATEIGKSIILKKLNGKE
jgi:hypothetical protein